MLKPTSTPSAMSTNGRTLKILCLHGYCQNAQLFRRKSGGLRKALERSVVAVRKSAHDAGQSVRDDDDEPGLQLAQLDYLDAPFVFEDRMRPAESAPPETEGDKYVSVYKPNGLHRQRRVGTGTTVNKEKEKGEAVSLDRSKRSWWRAEDDGSVYQGWEQTIGELRTVFRENQYDGVLGFSQGAVVASLICSLREGRDLDNDFTSLRFALMFSGAKSRAKVHAPWFKESTKLQISSLHVWGSQDAIVKPSYSETLSTLFDDGRRVRHIHEGGHMIPSDKTSRAMVSRFVLEMYDDMKNGNPSWLRAAL